MEYTEIDLNKVCRTCKNQALEMKSLYYKDSENAKENPRVDEMLIACTSVQIDTEDNLPKFICQSCFVQLKNAYTFKEQCEKTDVFMRNYLQTMKSIKVEDGLADVEFTTSEVVCDIKPLRLGNESVDKDVTDEIIDNSKVQTNQRVENEDMDYDQIIDNNVTLYKCRMCPKYFYILQGLRSHQRLHAGKTVKCRYCDKSFVYLNHLRQHESSHTKPKLHILKIGNKTDDRYENPNRIKNHVTTHKGKKVNISDVGNKTSVGDDSMEVNKRVHGNKNPVLPTFSDTEDVHVMVNVVNNVTIYKCIVCSKEFYTVEGLKCHKRLHIDKTFKCKQCDRTYTRLSHLQRHQLSHGKRKMYVCNICNKSFNRYEHLKRHLTTHLKTRPFSCPICKRGFNRVQRLEKHVTICKGKRMYVCDICNSAFRREDSMQVHKREHEHKGAVLPTLENLNNIQEYYTKVEVNDETKAFSDKENFSIVGKNMQADNNDQVRNDEIAPIINDYPNEHPSEVLLQKVKIEEELSLVSGNDAGEKQAPGSDNGNDYGSNDSGHHKYKPTNQSTPIVKRGRGRPGKYPVGYQSGGKPKGSKAPKRRRILQRTIKTKGGEIERLEIKSFQCEMCKKSFSRKERLQKHIKLLHLNSAAFKCDPCQAVFSREEDLAKHKICKHNSRETVVNNQRKDSQTNVHIGENKLQCKTCGKTFLSKSHLTEHTKFHSDSMKKFLCSECGQKFIRRDFLAIHMRRHRGEKPFKCKFCAYSFTRLADLTAHEKNHTGEKTHLCALCGRGFGRAYYLTLHMRRHTGEKPYRCSYCDAAFVQGSDLKVHVRRHTGERFSCELCSRTFLTASSLTQHKRVVHGLNIVNDRRSEVVKQLDPDDLPPTTLTLPRPIMITNSLTSDPLQINQ